MNHALKPLPASLLSGFPEPDRASVRRTYEQELSKLNRKIVVLDDDPTGIQTVHDVSVYTDWKKETLLEGFREKNNMFFVLTNSRGFTVEQTREAHREIAQNIAAAAKAAARFSFHQAAEIPPARPYPLETETLRQVLKRNRQTI
jgi:uncharacterized protein YgbK (DUF1537 family)